MVVVVVSGVLIFTFCCGSAFEEALVRTCSVAFHGWFYEPGKSLGNALIHCEPRTPPHGLGLLVHSLSW